MKIMRASAGSGKTYNLAKTYITILLKSGDRYAYRHILAVTFTNKATAEMKNRILKELHLLATEPRKSGYLSDFVPELVDTEDALQRRAKNILVDILHDYSAFSISTIDRFFQQALKAFSRELGHFSSYQVELDKKSLVHESVDRILDSLREEDHRMIRWLNEGVMEQLNRGERISIEKSLYEMAMKLKSDEFRELTADMEAPGAVLFSPERLLSIKRRCDQIVKAFSVMVQGRAKEVLAVFDAVGIDPHDTSYNFMECIKTKYAVLQPGEKVTLVSDSFLSRAADKDKWFAKTKRHLRDMLDGLLDEPLERFCSLFGEPYRVYVTATLLRKHNFSLGIAGELDKSFSELTKEKNVLGIDESNFILKEIIDGSDTPFIYEKLGVRYEHFLLDEFQDTSSIQWQNFLPLLRESNSHDDSTNLVVGDVKQSIYRWRGSDWKLLADTLPKSFFDVELKTLASNYRSASNIVTFNNALFSFASELLGLTDIYSDVRQHIQTDEPQTGSVKLTFCPAKDELKYMLDSILEVKAAGANYGDIAVLVRKNDSGAEAAAYLIDHGIPVISDDSLSVKSSVTVRRLVSLLHFVENPADTVSSFLAQSLNIAPPERYRSLADLCESLLRSLFEHDRECFTSEILFIQSFMDALQDWCSLNGQNLMQFLKFWEDADPKLSSPAGLDSVRIITVHKAKGLEFPHVIFPFVENVKRGGDAWHWCKLRSGAGEAEDAHIVRTAPAAGNTDLPADPGFSVADLGPALGGVYPIEFVKDVKYSLFGDEYDTEKKDQTVDNINILYVALTRAEKSLHVIAKTPKASCLKNPSNVSDFSQLVYAYAMSRGSEIGLRMNMVSEASSDMPDRENEDEAGEATVQFCFGEAYDFVRMPRKVVQGPEAYDAAYASIPLGGRLKLSEDASDFFAEDGRTGMDASPRVRGVILHSILSRVKHQEDLDDAVRMAVVDGLISEDEGRAVSVLLSDRISSAVERGWFPDSGEISTETTLIAADGEIQRPDRVVITQQGTVVIDYKFGSDRSDKYIYQVRRYVRLYKAMGYSNVTGYVWYVQDDEAVKV